MLSVMLFRDKHTTARLWASQTRSTRRAARPSHAFTYKHAKTHAHLHDLGVSWLICTLVAQIKLPKV